MYEAKRNNLIVSLNKTNDAVNFNSINDLLLYKSEHSIFSTSKFLSRANVLIENGATSFSVNKDNCLWANGWMLKEQNTFKIRKKAHPIILTPNSVVLYNFYAHSEFSSIESGQKIISHMLQDAFTNAEAETAYAFVESKNPIFREVIESMNFKYQKSYFRNPLNFLQN
jgi:hypothetical protein